MFEKLTFGAIALFMACKVYAAQLSPQEALARMNNTQSQSKGFVSDKTPMQLAYTSSFNGNNTYYVFNKDNNEGYVILSADDCMPAVLGVVDNGSFDINNVPENMKWWLSQYDISISNYASKGKKYVSSATKQNIAPLLGNIAYGQGEPYNDLCPQYNGMKALTGCVATAMAQIMRMHKWPKRGTGKNEYKCNFSIDYDDDTSYEPITLKTDFTQSVYRWDKMPETYMGIESSEEKQAVARLMYDCGVATNMDYGLYSSGAWESNALLALIKHFNYDRNAIMAERYVYGDAEWEDLMYENLSKGLPILFSGNDREWNGHEFVCDGYQANGNLFHFNWGWDGWDNGYFLMSSNDNDEKSHLFPQNQTAILNLKPASEPFDENKECEFPWVVSNPYELRADDYSSGGNMFKIESISRAELKDRIQYSRPIQLIGKPFITRYNGYSNRQYAIGIKAKSEKYEYVTTIHEGKVTPVTTFSATLLFNFYILRNGKYTLSLVYKDLTAGDTEWKEMKYLPGIEKPVLEVYGDEDDLCILEKPELIYDGKVIANEILPLKPNISDFTIRVKFKALNKIEARNIDCEIWGLGVVNPYVGKKTITVPAMSKNATKTIDITVSPEPFIPDMRFEVSFYESDEIIPYLTGGELSFSVIDAPTGIDTITQDEEKKATEVIYDIYGQKVKSMEKGRIYISGGKKFIYK